MRYVILVKFTFAFLFLSEVIFLDVYNVVYVMWTVIPGPLTNASLVAQTVGVCLQCRRPGFNPWVGKISRRRKWQPTPVFVPGKSHGRRNLVGSMGLDTTGQLHFLSFLSFWPMFSNALLKLFLQCSYIREISHLLAIRFAYFFPACFHLYYCLPCSGFMLLFLCCVLCFYSTSCNRICNTI